MRVLHVIPSIWSGNGGPSRSLVEMCRAVASADETVETTIATTSYGLTPAWHGELRRRLPARTRLLVFWQLGAHTASVSPSLVWWVWRHAQEFDVVHIHALFHPISSASAAAAAARRVPYILRPLGTLSPYTFAHRRTWLKETYFRHVDSRLIARAAALHFTAPQEAAKAARLQAATRAEIVPLPFAPDVAVERAEEPNTVVFMSRLDPIKGLDILLPAFARVLAVLPEARLVIAGSGTPEYEAALRAKVCDLQIAHATEFTGFVDGAAKRQLLSHAAAFVLTSYQENFGMAVVEAMAAGVPVVISDQVDLWPDVVQYGAGTVTPLDIDAVAGALMTTLRSADYRRLSGEGGRRLVNERYSPPVVGRALISMYERAQGTRRR